LLYKFKGRLFRLFFENKSNDSASAKKHWQEALELAKEINHEKWIKDIEENLAE